MNEAGSGGVVLLSFGSTIALERAPLETVHIFFKLMQKFNNVKYLLKWSGPFPDEYEGKLDNVLASDWIPQREVLRKISYVA